jgi:hypothetical protein
VKAVLTLNSYLPKPKHICVCSQSHSQSIPAATSIDIIQVNLKYASLLTNCYELLSVASSLLISRSWWDFSKSAVYRKIHFKRENKIYYPLWFRKIQRILIVFVYNKDNSFRLCLYAYPICPGAKKNVNSQLPSIRLSESVRGEHHLSKQVA